MSNQLSALLAAWQREPQQEWVLGTVYRTEGSAYRKAGAMMLINGLGQQFGLLSGGCLEADVMRNARRSMHDGQARLLSYDSSDEDDLSFQLGIGCGGKVYVMLQPLSAGNDLGLGAMAASLERREPGKYHQKIGAVEAYFEATNDAAPNRSIVETRSDGDWLVTPACPEPHLLVIGGGADARPVVSIAVELGWQVTLADPRPANARAEHFAAAATIIRRVDEKLAEYVHEKRIDAVVIMSHNVDLDAEALRLCQGTDVGYMALLGPMHRYRQVMERAGLTESQLSSPVSAPAGLDIGGQLPESIALSILCECHAVLHQITPELRLAAMQ